jgi:hypothetical protein
MTPTKDVLAQRFATLMKMTDEELYANFKQDEVNELPPAQQALVQMRFNNQIEAGVALHAKHAHVRFVLREAKIDYDAALASGDEGAIAVTKQALADAGKAFAAAHTKA